MANHSSATQREQTPHTNKGTKTKTLNLNGRAKEREETPHVNKSTTNKRLTLNRRSKKTDKTSAPGAVATGCQIAKNTLTLNGTSKTTISNALKHRAQAVIEDRSIDAQSRALIRYGLDINDPWLPELVRRAYAGETIINRRGLLANVRSLRRRFKRRKV